MKSPIGWKNLLTREWLLLGSFAGLFISSIYLKRLPEFSLLEFKVLFILFIFLVIIKGLDRTSVFKKIAYQVESSSLVPFKLVLASFFLSMFITNDVALLILVPLTIYLEIERKDLLVIFEALAANAGSALTPFGNPQNIFIFWYYDLNLIDFLKTIAPFSLAFAFLLGIAALFLPSTQSSRKEKEVKLSPSAKLYLAFLGIFILAAIKIIPLVVGVVVIFYAVIKDRQNLKIDYALLGTFLALFGFTENLKIIFSSYIKHPEHVFFLSAILSQIIGNVPTTILLAHFTISWKSLLWGVSVGGFGNLIGSLANLITYRLFTSNPLLHKTYPKFLLKFTLLSYLAFSIGIVLFYTIAH
ncbi:SLC13 family permease [Thermodesulfatator autotrophicus]|uniref:Citrate transporter-like domain-containing protein n=1 Tax=Thermodesulfatator autotrophicus TaxID=1795632 RepID=A0A177E5H7_9BACT|nr:SLC13 family permease [Thermodesulfatator autotrophicus]OAG27194.1 hypothetical protein TH606_08265 [Thermodesulfatator autotrophicus]